MSYILDAGEKEWLFKVCLLFATGASSMKVSTGNAPTKKEIQDLLKKHL